MPVIHQGRTEAQAESQSFDNAGRAVEPKADEGLASLPRYSRLATLSKRDWSQRYAGSWGVVEG